QAVATAYPVLTSSGTEARTIDQGHAVSSAAIGASGVWTISNLAPGTYVVNIEPAYYNEASAWVGAAEYYEDVTNATMIVVSTSKVSTGITYLQGEDEDDPSSDG